ncbi:MAG: damage-inducible protein [Bacteroidales bacterium]|nr:damage-inducible protein [Bacteroidales bacterium]
MNKKKTYFCSQNECNMSDIQETNSGLTFEDFKNENGITYWWATDLMAMMGYPDMKSFQKVLDRATKALVSLQIPHYENIIPEQRQVDGNLFQDFKMTRFACYITVMNGSPKKTEVALAQAYFAQQTRQFELFIQGNVEIDRLMIRDELVEGNKTLASAANQAGVADFASFQNAGYRGLYNMHIWQLKNRRHITGKATLADCMGRTELAANLFRVTQTEERIKNQHIQGQAALEQTHFQVGREVREIVARNTGTLPENLPQEAQLPDIKKQLKQGYKLMNKADKKK